MPTRQLPMLFAMLWLVAAVAGVAEPAEPRAARSVHLGYEAADVTAFSMEMTILDSTPGSYFMAAGWNTGYFGLQELADGRRVVIFSVWDPTAGDDPNAVREKDRVECLFQAPDVRIKRFGGEGTGGKPLRGLYSFVEDFRRDGRSAREVRRARFGDGWARADDGGWVPLRRARFTASGADWEAKDTIDAAAVAGQFLLATGGDTRQSRPLGSTLESEAADEPPPQVLHRLPRAPQGGR